ncbi:MAG: imidazolonepropionase [Bacteriovoracaceae bacterium]|nr:imidazolonepropionase [Bacteriovoracaceae bacterium]
MKAYRNLNQILTLAGAHNKDGRKLKAEDLAIVSDGAIVFDHEQILWVGRDKDFPSQYSSAETHNLSGHVLTPGLVDSHTHLVFSGDRAQEYAERLNGRDYQDIAKNGGGILYTVEQTLKSSRQELFDSSVRKIEKIISYGVRALEIKSGYTLTQEGEIKTLHVIADLKKHFSKRIQIFSTFMGAHAVPSHFSSSAKYISDVVIPTLIEAHSLKLVDFVDIFHEGGYFSTDDVENLFAVAKKLGFKVKLHADEFFDNSGARLGCDNHALSADHLLKVSDAGIASLASSETVATLLPGTAFFLGKPLPPARKLLDAGCKVSIASDYNPGSSHIDNLLLVASLSAPSLCLNQAELWSAITLNASAALGLKNHGYLAAGSAPCFSLFRASNLSQITYNWGVNLSVELP